ncbi:MAG: hypothetical protein HC896_17510 [Bacteroidales bacterium]|nr:hypothetical protein [Bacteroidales bacterium]
MNRDMQQNSTALNNNTCPAMVEIVPALKMLLGGPLSVSIKVTFNDLINKALNNIVLLES